MVTRLSPIAASLRYRMSGERAMQEVAAKTEVIEEEGSSDYPPAIYLPDQLEKIAATPDDTTLEQEMARLRGGAKRHAPLIRYEFEDALVFETGFTVGNASFARYGPLPIASLIMTRPRDLPRAHYAGSHNASRYFGHWLHDACATALLTREDESLFLPYGAAWPHAPEYMRLFAFPPPERPPARVGKLSFHSDFGQGRNRIRRYEVLRERLRQSMRGKTGGKAGGRVFLRRSGGEPRDINDESTLTDRLVREGFRIVDAASMSVEQMMKLALDADLCVTMEGSHQNHAVMFLRQGGTLINIQPSDRFNNMVQDFLPALGMRYGFMVAPRNGAGYDVDTEPLLRTIDLVERAKTAQH